MVIVMNEIVGVTPADLERYRTIVAGIEGMTEAEKDEAIRVVVSIMQAFVDAAWGKHPAQLAAEKGAQDSSQESCDNANMKSLGTALLVDLSNEGAITKKDNRDNAP